MKRFVLNYELDSGKALTFEFDEDIDFEKYNKTILEIYGKQITKRYIVDTQSGEKMNMKQLRALLAKEQEGL